MAEGGAPASGAEEGAVRDAVYGAVESVGRAGIAGELRGGGLGASGPACRALRIAAGRAGLPDPRAASGGAYDEGAAAAVLTTMLHYLLSAAAVPSQRKIRVGGADMDVVVPDAAALRAGRGAAVVVCVVGQAGGRAAGLRVREAAAAAAASAGPAGHAGADLWVAGWSHAAPAAHAAAGGGGGGGGARSGAAARTYLASDGSFASLVPDLAGFAAAAAPAAPGRGRRLGLAGASCGG